MGARPHALQHVLGVVVHAQDEDPRLGRPLPQLGATRRPDGAGHRDVQHHDVGMQAAPPGRGLRHRWRPHPPPRSRARSPARGESRCARSRDRRRRGPGSAAQSRAPGSPSGAGLPAVLPHRAAPRVARCPRARRSAPACPPAPCGPRARALRGGAVGGPRPSSLTSSSTPSRLTEMPMSTDAASAWRSTFESASCSARKSASSASLGERRERRAAASSSDPDAAALAEVGHQRAQRGQQAEVVQQRRAKVVGDAADAADAGVDEAEHLVQPRRLRRRHGRRAARRAPSSPRRTPGRSRRAARARAGGAPPRAARIMRAESRASSTVRVSSAAVEVGVFQRGSHLLAERDAGSGRRAR